jgi:hypothetical protein
MSRWWPVLVICMALGAGVARPGAAQTWTLTHPTGDGPLILAQFLPPPNWGYSLPNVAMADLRQSHDCAVKLPTFGYPDGQYWAPDGAMAMSNDGGWCWVQFGQVLRSFQFAPKTVVVDQPANGQVMVEQLPDRVSVAYRPSPGFAGADRFAVRTQGPMPYTIPFTVTVR